MQSIFGPDDSHFQFPDDMDDKDIIAAMKLAYVGPAPLPQLGDTSGAATASSDAIRNVPLKQIPTDAPAITAPSRRMQNVGQAPSVASPWAAWDAPMTPLPGPAPLIGPNSGGRAGAPQTLDSILAAPPAVPQKATAPAIDPTVLALLTGGPLGQAQPPFDLSRRSIPMPGMASSAPQSLPLPSDPVVTQAPPAPIPQLPTLASLVGPDEDEDLYNNPDGSQDLRTGGSKAWRTNNPGNLGYGDFALSHGAIGKHGESAIFPDAETGSVALDALLNSPAYQQLTLDGAIRSYAPNNENNTAAYQAFIRKGMGLPGETALSSLSADQMKMLSALIKRYEGQEQGIFTHYPVVPGS